MTFRISDMPFIISGIMVKLLNPSEPQFPYLKTEMVIAPTLNNDKVIYKALSTTWHMVGVQEMLDIVIIVVEIMILQYVIILV